MQQERSAPFARPDGTVAGIVIAVSAGLAVVAMSHHPSARVVHDPAAAIAALNGIAGVDRIVHGAMIALMGALLFGFVVFSMRRGFDKQTVLAGLTAYAVGTGALIGAALINGFLVPGIAEQYAAASPDGTTFALRILSICWLANQVLAKFGVVALTLAIVAWSSGLIAASGMLRVTGIVGLAAAALSAGVLVFGGGALTVSTFSVVVVGQAVWYFAVAALLVRGRV